MRAVIQKSGESRVSVEGNVVGSIKNGLVIFLAVHKDDTEDLIDKMVNKILKLRIFLDEEGKMNKSIKDAGGEILLVSQFTLYGDCKKGNRPSFIESALPEKAKPFYDQAEEKFRKEGLEVQTGEFGAFMNVNIENQGPITLILDF
jgi:D-tyrosyl-tRNA(Tyr) deacylase